MNAETAVSESTTSPRRDPAGLTKRHRESREQAALGRAPLGLVVPAGLAAAFLAVPLLGLLWRTPWGRMADILNAPGVATAIWLSLFTSTVAALACVPLGLPLAWVLARSHAPGLSVLRALVAVPLVLPPVVGGVALLAGLGRTGLLGKPLLDIFGVTVTFSTTAVVLAHTFVALPFFVLAAEGALRSAGRQPEVVAAGLGATRWFAFRTVTVPIIAPGLGAGLLLAWARSLGEFGATITFAGNYTGTTQTMPLLIFERLQNDPGAAYGLSVVMLGVSLAVLVVLRGRWIGGLR